MDLVLRRTAGLHQYCPHFRTDGPVQPGRYFLEVVGAGKVHKHPTATGVAAVEPPNSIIDFLLVILAVAMVRSLKMSNQNKWRLRFVFGLGAL